MASVIVSAAAEIDYFEALLWYAARSASAAEKFERDFAEALESIAESPQQFARLDDRHRRFLMQRFPFQIVYRETDEQQLVVAVAHAKRKPHFWRRR
jgi:plasmid stabilization system protein ParE